MDQKVLVLNGDYTAITLCSVQKAFVLLFLDKAEMVAKSESGVMRTISQAFPKPSIIRLARYVRVPYKVLPSAATISLSATSTSASTAARPKT